VRDDRAGIHCHIEASYPGTGTVSHHDFTVIAKIQLEAFPARA